MKTHARSRRVQDRALALIANISFGCAHRKRVITRQGAIPAIIAAMTTFSNDLNIQLRSALAIRNLTHQTQVNQYLAGNEGAVEAIASAMLRFRGSNVNPELRFQCIMALESLCHEHERNRQRLTDVDATPISFPTTLCSSTSAELLKPSHANHDDDEVVNEDGDVVVEEEQVLVSDVTPHFRHGAALCPGKLVSNLVASPSVSSSGYSDRAPTSPLSNRDHSTPEKEKQAIEQEEKPSIKKPSIIRAIIHAMRRDPDDAMLLVTSLSVLTLIALHNVQVQHKIGLFGGIQVAVAAIKRHPKHAAVAAKSCALIRCLCLQETNRRLITSGLPVLISALKEHRSVPDVVREVAAALSNAVFENEKNRAWVVNKGGIQAIIEAMNDCGAKDVMVLDAGICAMRNFVDSSYSGALSAVKDGAVQAAVSALDRTKDASTKGECIVQEQAVLFLVDVASLAPQAKKHMRDADAADWIENALAKLSAERYAELHSAADSLIAELTGQGGNLYGKSRTASSAGQRGSAKPSGRPPRGLFGGFLLPRRAATTTDTRKRFGGRSMPLGSGRTEIPRKGKRLSTRLRFGTALS
ncbi:Armadillo-like helical domain containing protein [Gracilaria domingensis]|nr:Armadillo-like helical domain containing protein [Gracilaria domingensis]